MNAKSLKSYREKFSTILSLRTSLLPYEQNEGTKNIPLYMLFAIADEMSDWRFRKDKIKGQNSGRIINVT